LAGKVAIVTGASKGVGKGIALGLAEAGATVYVTGRNDTIEQGNPNSGSVTETAIQVNGLGGKGIGVVCDHGKDEDIAALFDQVLREQGKIDILVNNVWQHPDYEIAANVEHNKSWENGTKFWDPVMNVGLRSHFVASCHAAKVMAKQKSGTIINISSAGSKYYAFYLAYGVAKTALDRMTQDLGKELKPFDVSVISLWPGLVKTERNLQFSEYIGEKFGVNVEEKGESPMYTGRAVAALCADSNVIKKSGTILNNEEVAKEYGFTDLDGRQPHAVDTWGFAWDHFSSFFWKKELL